MDNTKQICERGSYGTITWLENKTNKEVSLAAKKTGRSSTWYEFELTWLAYTHKNKNFRTERNEIW